MEDWIKEQIFRENPTKIRRSREILIIFRPYYYPRPVDQLSLDYVLFGTRHAKPLNRSGFKEGSPAAPYNVMRSLVI